jgi:Membrane protein involved in the export of O-antigen and teichoic acid
MANPIKKLAGETAIYGLSSILARMINFFFVPIYSRILSQDGYGAYSELISYIAVLQVIFTLGLETGCFKFAVKESEKGKDPSAPFSNALSIVTTISLLAFIIITLFAPQIANIMGYQGYSNMIIFIGGILALDSITAILFARLRYYHKAFKFAIFKSIKILSEFGFNLLLFFAVPPYLASHSNSALLNIIPAQIDFSYITFAIFLSCIICTLLFIPDFFRVKFSISPKLLREMLIYSLPIMIAGLPGTLNESLDRLLFRFFAPEGLSWRAELGVYQAAAKLAVIMNLFIQMFRYAAEPFFFSREKEKGSKELYAKVMEYFIAFCMLIFLGVTLFIDSIGLILGRDFRGALGTVPYMLISYMLLGMIFNVSMWYKLSGKTNYAIYITSSGLMVTAIVNIILMPYLSYWASIIAHILSCLTMLIYSIWLGNKYYPIPYKWKRICTYVFLALALYAISVGALHLLNYSLGSTMSDTLFLIIKLIINTILILIYVIFCIKWGKLINLKSVCK